MSRVRSRKKKIPKSLHGKIKVAITYLFEQIDIDKHLNKLKRVKHYRICHLDQLNLYYFPENTDFSSQIKQ